MEAITEVKNVIKNNYVEAQNNDGCESGWSPTSWTQFSDPTRHAIVINNYKGTTLNISKELTDFDMFAYNPVRKRLSFRTKPGSNYRKQFSGYPGKLCSNDPVKHKFNELFLKLNPQIPFSNIETYDFLDMEGDDKFLIKTLKNLKVDIDKGIDNSGKLLGGIIKVLPYIVVAGGGYILYNEVSKK
ncbi:MAG: hypothetical protein KDH96_01740 [Candidatus Riesia sp.]|nr:hypothetical protein [Candidatus Riesia sp.]